MTQTVTFGISDVTPYVNWIYFFHAWGVAPRFAAVARLHDCPGCRAAWLTAQPDGDRSQAEAAAALYDDAVRMLARFSADFHTYGRVGLYPAWSDGDDLVLRLEDGSCFAIPCLRQQRVAREGEPYLCLADYLPPEGYGEDRLGVFATAVDAGMEHLYGSDDYSRMLAQTLCDRLAEATAELLHRDVRRRYWGYAPGEDLPLDDLLAGRFQGIRPAVGYPSLPDQSMVFLLDRVLHLGDIGITLTESGAMRPHASTCGLMFSHPAARYFAVGPIDRRQFEDYARRRGMEPAALRRFLQANYSPSTDDL